MLLRLDAVTRRFGGLVAVDNLSFDVSDNEIVGVIGPNGAGKTTALNLISGMQAVSSGRVFLDDEDITRLKSHQIASRGVGRTFQSSVLFMDLSLLENVYIALHLSYRTTPWRRLLRLPAAMREERDLQRQAAEILERMGLGHLKDEITMNLPHGQQRALGVCIALATKPRLLLLDEPLTGMNANEIQDMLALVRGIRDDGVAIVMIEHNMGAVMSLCDRLVVMDHGQKIAEGLPAEIQRDSRVVEAYLGSTPVAGRG